MRDTAREVRQGPDDGPSSSDDVGGMSGEGTIKQSVRVRADGGGDAARVDPDGTVSGCGGTGASTKPILDVPFFFSLAISLMIRALRGPVGYTTSAQNLSSVCGFRN